MRGKQMTIILTAEAAHAGGLHEAAQTSGQRQIRRGEVSVL